MTNVAVIGVQWGDEGKGKIVDWLSARADVVVQVLRDAQPLLGGADLDVGPGHVAGEAFKAQYGNFAHAHNQEWLARACDPSSGAANATSSHRMVNSADASPTAAHVASARAKGVGCQRSATPACNAAPGKGGPKPASISATRSATSAG